MSKRHNHRQRKKLHLGEYRELGFNLEINLHDHVDEAGEDKLVEAFVDAVIESRGLIYGGLLSYGFVCRAVRGDATEEDRELVRTWLTQRPEVESVVVGELVDAWR